MNNRLYRSLDDRVLAGVAGGMAEAYDLDPALVRLGWALLIVFTGGAFLVIYVIMALVVPVEPYGPPRPIDPNAPPSADPTAPPGPVPAWTGRPYPRRRREGGGALVIGLLLVLLGIYLLARQFFPLFDLGRFWPVILVLIGVALVVSAFGRRPR